MGEQTSQDQEFSQEHLFKLTMEKKWEAVKEIYYKNPTARTTKLTKSEETGLHIAVSSYRSTRRGHQICAKEMIDIVDPDELALQNAKGDTPLHVAAAVGWVAIFEPMVEKNPKLMRMRNAQGETPLFVAAHHGSLQGFLCLHELWKGKKDGNVNEEGGRNEPDKSVYVERDDEGGRNEPDEFVYVERYDEGCDNEPHECVYVERDDEGGDNEHVESLCRRKDGNTILHLAISGEYLRLAYQIICYYPKLLNAVNVDGETALHVLARKPNVFESSSNFGFCDKCIYYCVFVDELKEQKYNPRATQNDYTPASEINVPENYRTCVDIFFLFWNPIFKSILAGLTSFRKQNSSPTDEENQQLNKNESERNDMRRGRKDVYPSNYATFIMLFKILMKVILTVLGIGFGSIKKIQDKKERYSHAVQIMNKMLESEAGYKYDDNGQRPIRRPEIEPFRGIPNVAPKAEHFDLRSTVTGVGRPASSTQDQNKKDNDKDHSESDEKNPNALVKKDSPLLIAAKMGIPEMVKKIIRKCPVAIQDQDSNGKNVLLLTAENRHTSVLDALLKDHLPDYMFQQLDNEGNSVLHLAAMLGVHQPWHIPGAALQMQWEIKWYRHVKKSVPAPSFAHQNAKGETPGDIFTRTHQDLVKEGNEWLIKTSESCSVVAALIAAVAFATSGTVPGGLHEENGPESGRPILLYHRAFDIFSITSVVALCLSVTAMVFFLAIITSRCEESDFKVNLPRKLLLGLTSLFASIAAILLSFCAGHTFILREKLKFAAWPIYAIAGFPVTYFALAQLPLYFDLLWAATRKVPLRSYKAFYL